MSKSSVSGNSLHNTSSFVYSFFPRHFFLINPLIKPTFVEDPECHQLEDYRNQQTIVEESAKHVFALGNWVETGIPLSKSDFPSSKATRPCLVEPLWDKYLCQLKLQCVSHTKLSNQ